MGGQNIFDLIAQGISELLDSKLAFLQSSGLNLFRGLAIIMIAWYGVKSAISSAQGGEGFNFAKFVDMLLLIAFGFAMLTYYASPLPGMEHSFSELVTKQASYLSGQIGGNQAEMITTAISTAGSQFGHFLSGQCGKKALGFEIQRREDLGPNRCSLRDHRTGGRKQ